MSKDERKERWLVQSHNQALSKGALRTLVWREKAKVKVCTRVSPREPADVTGLFARPTRVTRREKLAWLGFDTVLDNPYSSAPRYSRSVPSFYPSFLPTSPHLIPWRFSRRLLKHKISSRKIAYRENVIKLV